MVQVHLKKYKNKLLKKIEEKMGVFQKKTAEKNLKHKRCIPIEQHAYATKKMFEAPCQVRKKTMWVSARQGGIQTSSHLSLISEPSRLEDVRVEAALVSSPEVDLPTLVRHLSKPRPKAIFFDADPIT